LGCAPWATATLLPATCNLPGCDPFASRLHTISIQLSHFRHRMRRSLRVRYVLVKSAPTSEVRMTDRCVPHIPVQQRTTEVAMHNTAPNTPFTTTHRIANWRRLPLLTGVDCSGKPSRCITCFGALTTSVSAAASRVLPQLQKWANAAPDAKQRVIVRRVEGNCTAVTRAGGEHYLRSWRPRRLRGAGPWRPGGRCRLCPYNFYLPAP
jgi:hypothetical protein